MFHSQISCHQVLPSPGSVRPRRHHQRRSSGFSPSMKAQRMRRLQQITRSLRTLPFRHRTPYEDSISACVLVHALCLQSFSKVSQENNHYSGQLLTRINAVHLRKENAVPFADFFGVIPLPGET